jgi:hypothetical protein
MIFLPTSSNIFVSKDKKELKVKSAVENMQKNSCLCLVKKYLKSSYKYEYSVAISNKKIK